MPFILQNDLSPAILLKDSYDSQIWLFVLLM